MQPPLRLDERVILSVGRLEPYKGVDRVLEALALLDRSFVLRVVGAGPHAQALARRADELGVDDRVAFLGHVTDDELARWYRSAAAYVGISSGRPSA